MFFFSSDLKGTWLAGRDPERQERADSTELRQAAVAPGLRKAPADPGSRALAWDSTQMPPSRSGTADHHGHSRAEDPGPGRREQKESKSSIGRVDEAGGGEPYG